MNLMALLIAAQKRRKIIWLIFPWGRPAGKFKSNLSFSLRGPLVHRQIKLSFTNSNLKVFIYSPSLILVSVLTVNTVIILFYSINTKQIKIHFVFDERKKKVNLNEALWVDGGSSISFQLKSFHLHFILLIVFHFALVGLFALVCLLWAELCGLLPPITHSKDNKAKPTCLRQFNSSLFLFEKKKRELMAPCFLREKWNHSQIKQI